MAASPGEPWRPLAWAGYAVAAMLLASILTNTSQILQATVPPGGLQWRFSLMGFAFAELPSVVMGWAIAALSSGLLGHRRMAHGLSVAQVVFALLLLVGTGFFVLDWLQLRPNVNPTVVHGFDTISISSGVLGALAGACLIGMGVGTWKLGGTGWDGGRPKPSKGSPADKLVPR